MAFKIDLEKAYDRMDWNFLRATLLDFGFPQVLVNLIMSCVMASNLSILWNGSKLENFSPTRGLRQGDPMSPYLFVLCMEKLARMIQMKVDERSWHPILLSRQGPAISHLLFADDVLLFCKVKKSQVRVVLETLDKFCNMSGLKVSLEKSRAFCSPKIPRSKRESIGRLTSIRFVSDLGRYLGVPILKGRVKRATFNLIIEKITTRLATWKSKLLNKVGKLYLAQSVISAMPIHTMQALWLPDGVCRDIDKLTRGFLWGRKEHSKGMHLVDHTVIKPKNCGGLNIRDSRHLNTALLGKMIWNNLNEPGRLSSHVLTAKYLGAKSFFLAQPRRNCSYVWRGILKARQYLKDGFQFRLGSGNMSIWYDHWFELDRLCNLVDYVHISDSMLKVHDIWKNGRWDFSKLATILLITLKRKFSNLDISSIGMCSDC